MLLKKKRSATLEKCLQQNGQHKRLAILTILFLQMRIQHGAAQDEHRLHDHLIQCEIC